MKKIPRYKGGVPNKNGIKVNKTEMNPLSLRSYSLVPEYYLDEIKKCEYCDMEFIFTASQKKFMYEIKKLHVAVTRKHCSKCRMTLNKLENNIKEIETFVRPKGTKQTCTISELEKLIKLYEERSKYTFKNDRAKISRLKGIHADLKIRNNKIEGKPNA